MAILGQEGCSSYAGVLDDMVCHQACPHKPMKLNTCDCLGHNISQNWAILFHAALGNVIPALGNLSPLLGNVNPARGNLYSSTGQCYSRTGQCYSSTGYPLVRYWATLFQYGQPLVQYWEMLVQHMGNVIPALGNFQRWIRYGNTDIRLLTTVFSV